MATLKLQASNPLDGTTTFDQIVFIYADNTSGTNKTDIATVSIDTSTVTSVNPGYTSYTYESANLSKYFSAEYKNSISGNRTTAGTSDYVLGAKDRWDAKFEKEMNDTSNAVWSQSLLKDFKQNTLNALYPELTHTVIDTSLTIDKTTGALVYVYTLPFGIFNISEVGIGDVNNNSSDEPKFKTLSSSNWKFEQNKLHILDISNLEDNQTIRLVAQKKFLYVGEVPERFDYIALSHLKMQAYNYLAKDYPRFLTYARLQEGTKVSFENLRVEAREWERKFKEDKALMAESLNASRYY